MIIQSKFRDYYDNCVGFGIDKAVVYNRVENVISQPKRAVAGRSANDNLCVDVLRRISANDDLMARLGVPGYHKIHVGFCGKIHVGLYYATRHGELITDKNRIFSADQMHFAWSENDLTDEQLHTPHRSWSTSKNGSTLAKWFEKNEGHFEIECEELFMKHKLVSFCVDNQREALIVNPILKNYGFQKIKDGIQAFQEITMHISGPLYQCDKEPDPISDVLRAHAKGFDKNSFRKGPGGS